MIDNRFIYLIKELENILYSKLKESKNGELSFEDILELFDLKAEYGLRKVSGGAISMIKQRNDVEQLKDRLGRPYLKLTI